jgi:hypothetical protein
MTTKSLIYLVGEQLWTNNPPEFDVKQELAFDTAYLCRTI